MLSSLYLNASTPREIVNVGREYGMPLRKVTSLCSDTYGFVYGVSDRGVTRISSSDCRTYELADSLTLFLARMCAVGNDVYMLTHNGRMCTYDRVNDCFTAPQNLAHMHGGWYDEVYAAVPGPDSLMYVSASSGMLLIKDAQMVGVIDSVRVWAAAQTDDRHMAYVTEQAVKLYDADSRNTSVLYEPPAKMAVKSLFYNPEDRRLWIGTTSDGVYTMPLDGNAPPHKVNIINVKKPVRAITAGPEASVLIGVDGGGVYEVSADAETIYNIYTEDIDNPRGLLGNGVNALLYTPDKIWIATYSGGISYFRNKTMPLTMVQHLPGVPASITNNQINKVIQDSRGCLWVATDNGVSRRKPDSEQWSHYLRGSQGEENVVLALCEDIDGNIWVGTYSAGLYVLDGESGSVRRHFDKADSQACQSVFDIRVDADGDMWIGGVVGGATLYNTSTGRFLDSKRRMTVSGFLLTPQGEVCTVGAQGVLRVDKVSGDVDELFLLSETVNQCVFHDGRYWGASARKGLIEYDRKNDVAKFHTTAQGLPSNLVRSVIPLSEHSLLVATEDGLCRFDTSDGSVEHIAGGLAFNQGAACRLVDGRYAFGTSSGLLIYSPADSHSDDVQARLFMQNVLVGGRPLHEVADKMDRPLDDMSDIYIDYTKDAISFEALYLAEGSSDLKISWMLEGIDSDWSVPSNATTIAYANIPWGKYSLNIRLYDSGGSDILDQREITLHVQPPFWATWWFIAIMVFVVLFLVFSIIYIRMKRTKERYLEEKLRFITQTMLEMQRTTNVMKAPIGQLKTDDSGDGRDYYLKLLNRQTDRLSLLFAQLFTLEEEESNANGFFLTPRRIAAIAKRRRDRIESAKLEEVEHMANDVRSSQAVKEKERGEEFVAKAMEVVRANITNSEFGKDDFASAMCVSPSLLYKRLKQETGLSIVDFIKSMRMNYAMELLKTHEYSVTRISEMCGFSSSTYFGVVFKKYYGMSPTEILEDKKQER